jgi:hypothetical protein
MACLRCLMVLFLLWVLLAVTLIHLCSLLETTLFAVRISTLLDRSPRSSNTM